MRYVLYAHGGSANHGCEAIVRGTSELLNLSSNDLLLSANKEEDSLYGLNWVLSIADAKDTFRASFWDRIKMKLSVNPDRYYFRQIYRNLSHKIAGFDVAVSIGGDNYCYKGFPIEMETMNRISRSEGLRTILWGCSIEPEIIKEKQVCLDLKKFDWIYARESITYQSLLDHGLTNAFLAPDPAFFMKRIDLPLPDGFIEGNMVGINLSPLIMNYEQSAGATLKNYMYLIDFILSTTDMRIALIPHVVWSHNDDRLPLKELYSKYRHTGRVILLDDFKAEELKGFIARCRFMIAARTHASIAAYSQKVPTLVVGYSVKARGIAKDLFGTEDHYVLPVQSLDKPDELVRQFQWLYNQEKAIRSHYEANLDTYKAGIKALRTHFLDKL